MSYLWVLGYIYIKGHWRPCEMIFDDHDGQRYPGMDGAQDYPTCLTVEEKPPRKQPEPGKLTWPGIEPGPAR